MSLTIDVEGLSDHRGANVGIKILDSNDQWLVGLNTEMKLPEMLGQRERSEQVTLQIPSVPFVPGKYWIDIDIDQKGSRIVDGIERTVQFEVLEADVYGTGYRVQYGVVYLDAHWQMKSAYGIS